MAECVKTFLQIDFREYETISVNQIAKGSKRPPVV